MNIYFLHSVERVVKWAKRYTTTRVIYIYIYIVYSVYINYDREDMCTIETITDMHYSSIGFTYEWTFDTLAANSGGYPSYRRISLFEYSNFIDRFRFKIHTWFCGFYYISVRSVRYEVQI